MKVFLLRAIAIVVGFPLAMLTTVFAAQYAQEFYVWFVRAMSWGSGNAGDFALALVLSGTVVIGGMLPLIASVILPLDLIKSSKQKDGSQSS